ncbi:hypothetical protein HGRIS_013083 [Hohenbuehelia grisea]|uniref:Uncharacterized protein n=1 Tax=Hohenbuehelia grisea TaxID=104357 RepID=A0ABR3IUG2_9AGAR
MGTALSLQDTATRVHFASKPTYLSSGNGDDAQISLRELVETKCRSLFTSYKPAWWLFNGHLQTIYCVLGDFTKVDQLTYDRTYLRLRDGGTIGLDFAPLDKSSVAEDVPIIVVLHGLTGGKSTLSDGARMYADLPHSFRFL